MKRVVITAMLALLAVGVCAVPARAAVDIYIGIPGVVIVPPSDHYDYPRYVYPDSEPRYDYPRYVYPDSEPRYYYYKHYRRWHHHGHRHHHHGHGR
jgi:hypothetical protein